ncbi:MAG: hypothetical protein BWK76_19195 [Desulfobulbaceae bacterium A2]|nr:MAG: hypothetical protein BWK76_19195 [Desulfobulbaceae bacterium A2]
MKQRGQAAWLVVVPCGVLLSVALVLSSVWAMDEGGREMRPPGAHGAAAERHGMPPPPPRCAPVLHLGLTDSQQQQILALRQAEHQAVEGALQTVRAQQDKLQQIIRAESFDEKGLRTLLAESNAARTELHVQRLRGLNGMWNLLTPAQRELAVKGGVAPHGWGRSMGPEMLLLEEKE